MAKIKQEVIEWTTHEITKWIMANLTLSKNEYRLIPCPKSCGYAKSSLPKIIVHMNDGHELSFLEIADLLEANDLNCDITTRWEF